MNDDIQQSCQAKGLWIQVQQIISGMEWEDRLTEADRQIDRQIDRQTDKQIDRWLDGQTDRQTSYYDP